MQRHGLLAHRNLTVAGTHTRSVATVGPVFERWFEPEGLGVLRCSVLHPQILLPALPPMQSAGRICVGRGMVRSAWGSLWPLRAHTPQCPVGRLLSETVVWQHCVVANITAWVGL